MARIRSRRKRKRIAIDKSLQENAKFLAGIMSGFCVTYEESIKAIKVLRK